MKNRLWVIVLVVVGVLSLLCCAGGAVALVYVPDMAETMIENMIIEDPAEVEAMGQEIANYTLPDGFNHQMAMNMFGINMVFISDGVPSPTDGVDEYTYLIMLMRIPSAFGDSQDIEEQARQSFAEQTGANFNTQVVDTREIVLNGRTTTLTVEEGTDENGVDIRQMYATFQTPTGDPAVLFISGSILFWDEAVVNQFLDSMQ